MKTQMKKEPIKIILLESNHLLREGLMKMLEAQKDMTASAFSDYKVALEKAGTFGAHVLLIDLGIEQLPSLEVIVLFKKKYPDITIIAMNMVPLQLNVIDLVKAGTTGFIVKTATMEEFLHTVRAAAKGESILPKSVTNSLLSQVVEYGIQHEPPDVITESVQMTAREREVINFIAMGKSNKEIADKMFISVQTVKTHVHNILEKMSLRSRLELANFVYTSRTTDGSGNKDEFFKARAEE